MSRSGYVPEMEAPADQRPAQYGTVGRCIECMAFLSRYNPYQVCGPCRVRLAAAIPQKIAAAAETAERSEPTFVWERFPKRKADGERDHRAEWLARKAAHEPT